MPLSPASGLINSGVLPSISAPSLRTQVYILAKTSPLAPKPGHLGRLWSQTTLDPTWGMDTDLLCDLGQVSLPL